MAKAAGHAPCSRSCAMHKLGCRGASAGESKRRTLSCFQEAIRGSLSPFSRVEFRTGGVVPAPLRAL